MYLFITFIYKYYANGVVSYQILHFMKRWAFIGHRSTYEYSSQLFRTYILIFGVLYFNIFYLFPLDYGFAELTKHTYSIKSTMNQR